MKILALDSSTVTASAAVLDGDTVLSECSCGVRATHAEQLLPLVRDALQRACVTLGDIEVIAAGIGPGSFTGVRIGLATAKGLSVATELPLMGVSTLDALGASAWCARDGVVLAALDARRGELYAASWRVQGDARELVLAPCNARSVDIAARLAEECVGLPVWVVGDASVTDLDVLSNALGDKVIRAPGVCASPLARWIGNVAARGGGVVDDGSLEPMYLRGSDAKLPRARA